MTWYNYEKNWVNIQECIMIRLHIHARITFTFYGGYGGINHQIEIIYPSQEERDLEFEKLKKLMLV